MLARAHDTNGTKLICSRSKGSNDLLFPIISWSEVSDLSPRSPLLVMQTEQKAGDYRNATESRVKTISYQWAQINAPDYRRGQGKQSLWSFSQGGENTRNTLFTANCHAPDQHQERPACAYTAWGQVESGLGRADQMHGQPPTLHWWATISSSRRLFRFC